MEKQAEQGRVPGGAFGRGQLCLGIDQGSSSVVKSIADALPEANQAELQTIPPDTQPSD
jgi:hypothetical protein